MARITIYNRSIKTKGSINIRFRLSDGRGVQLFHKSEITADLEELSKFESDGTPKKRSNYNRKLADAIRERITLMQEVYQEGYRNGLSFTNATFDEEVNKRLRPNDYQEESKERQLLFRFKKYISSGPFSEGRTKSYMVTANILERFLVINNIPDATIDDVTPDFLRVLRGFIADEWKYAQDAKYMALYADMKPQNIPSGPRAQNTIANKLKMLQAFFAMLEDADEIVKTPFRKLGRETRSRFLKEQYAAPIALTIDEVRQIINSDVKEELKDTKDAFLLQCALGCRISDFKSMGMRNLAVSPEGIPYIRYIAEKTRTEAAGLSEIKTPLIRFAFDIVRRTEFNIPILRNISGKDGYNIRIKKLLEECGINREVGVWNEKNLQLEYFPLYTIGSTKLGRKTNVTLLSRVQINSTIAGLHATGSEAAERYYDKSLEDIFNLMSKAFEEPTYRTDENYSIIQ